MKRPLLAAAIALSTWQSAYAESVSIPWPDFQKLYEAHVKRRLVDAMPKAPKAQRYAIEKTNYQLTVGPDGAKGTVTLTGQHLGGETTTIPLFGSGFVLTESQEITGGTLVNADEYHPIGLLPDGSGAFKAVLSFMVRPKRDKRSHILSIEGPQALSRSLQLTLEGDAVILDAPGIRDAAGTYRLAATENLFIRYGNRAETATTTARIQVDISTVLTVGDQEIYGTTYLNLPPNQSAQRLTVALPEGARWLDADLPTNPDPTNKRHVHLNAPMDYKGPQAVIRWALDHKASPISLQLPTILNNRGQQGRFIVNSPSYTKVDLAGPTLATGIPPDHPTQPSTIVFGPDTPFNRIDAVETVTLTINRFEAVKMPQTVLNEVQLRVAFDDNGGILSRLRMQVPSREQSLRLKPIEKATIWALTVNGKKESPYVGPAGEWIIPLSKSGTSDVELTFLREGSKLGLHGRLEALVPATGLPTKNLLVFASLPKRLDVISMEGPVTAAAHNCRTPNQGKTEEAYAFSRAYHDGSAVTVALFYKEPVNEEKNQ